MSSSQRVCLLRSPTAPSAGANPPRVLQDWPDRCPGCRHGILAGKERSVAGPGITQQSLIRRLLPRLLVKQVKLALIAHKLRPRSLDARHQRDGGTRRRAKTQIIFPAGWRRRVQRVAAVVVLPAARSLPGPSPPDTCRSAAITAHLVVIPLAESIANPLPHQRASSCSQRFYYGRKSSSTISLPGRCAGIGSRPPARGRALRSWAATARVRTSSAGSAGSMAASTSASLNSNFVLIQRDTHLGELLGGATEELALQSPHLLFEQRFALTRRVRLGLQLLMG